MRSLDFQFSFLQLYGRNSGTKWLKSGAKMSLEVLLKLWYQSGISFLRLSTIKIVLFSEKSMDDFSQNVGFQILPSYFFNFMGGILVPNGWRAVPKGAWRSCKSFGTLLASVSFDFPPLKEHFFQNNFKISRFWQGIDFFQAKIWAISTAKCMKRAAKLCLAVL